MAARREENGTWSTSFRYSDWEGKSRLKHARGFKEEAEADAFERDFKRMASSKSGMPFEVFAEKYLVLALPQNQPNAPLYPAGGAPGGGADSYLDSGLRRQPQPPPAVVYRIVDGPAALPEGL